MPLPSNAIMIRDIKRFSQKEYDLLVIGGGINGCAIANLASGAGMKVALVDKGDFASGTSTKTTKLIHGGIRYLENFEFDLVYEALHERFIQLKTVPYLVKPLGFVVPVYKKDARPLWMMRIGVWLYDFLSGAYVIEKHRYLTVRQITGLVPGIKQEDLVGGVMYYDAQMDDARVCLENALMADHLGAHLANYVEVTNFLKRNGKVTGVRARDVLTEHTFEIKAKKVVCAIGPWTNHFLRLDNPRARARVRTTKGVHLVYRGQMAPQAILLSSQQDKRIFFIIPWKGNSLIGTTDTDYFDSPNQVSVKEEDVDYLLREAQRIFPDKPLSKDNIITTFAGLRPLVHDEGAPAKVSRKHVIEETYSGLIFVMGGKYTTYRKIAEDCLQFLRRNRIPLALSQFHLYGSGAINAPSQEIAQHCSLDEATVDILKNTYGIRYQQILKLVEKNPQWKNCLCSCSPAIEAQVVYAIESEMAQTKEDIIWRRLSIGYNDCPTKQCRERIQQILAEFKST